MQVAEPEVAGGEDAGMDRKSLAGMLKAIHLAVDWHQQKSAWRSFGCRVKRASGTRLSTHAENAKNVKREEVVYPVAPETSW